MHPLPVPGSHEYVMRTAGSVDQSVAPETTASGSQGRLKFQSPHGSRRGQSTHVILDSDMVALRSWEPLLYYSTTLGIQTQRDLGNAVIISMKNATFINLWMSSYQHFKGKEFGFNSCIVPLVLAKRYPKLIHLEANTLYRPNSHMTEWIYGKGKLWDWSGSYGMHLYYRLYKKDHTLEDMKTLNTTIGQLFRLIYFNNTAIIH